MRQRVSLARTVVHRPSMLMLDEPFGALDALTRLQVRHDLEQLWLTYRPTVLFVTHSVEEAVGLSDRIVVFSTSPGSIVEQITVDLPRPRPLALGDTPEYAKYADRVFEHFENMGVLNAEGEFKRAPAAEDPTEH
jgi:NitT/TauT family transport system ATP-binding protein